MNRITLLLFLLIMVCASFVFKEDRYYRYTPVFMERSELENSVSYQSKGRDLVNPGKIYHKAPYIYVNERYKGIHVINNTNPANPVNEGFIIAPGCIDMAVKEDILYIDNSIDLVAFNLNTKQVAKRIKDVFPEPLAPDNTYHYYNRPENTVIVEWKKND